MKNSTYSNNVNNEIGKFCNEEFDVATDPTVLSENLGEVKKENNQISDDSLSLDSYTTDTEVLAELDLVASKESSDSMSDAINDGFGLTGEFVDPKSETESVVAVDTIISEFSERLKAHEEIIRKMSSLIEKLSNDQVRTLLKPVYTKLAEIHTLATSANKKATEKNSNFMVDFEYIVDSIEELFSLYGIEVINTQVGIRVDPKKHHPERIFKTADESLDGTIRSVIRQGLICVGEERTILPARITAYKYDSTL